MTCIEKVKAMMPQNIKDRKDLIIEVAGINDSPCAGESCLRAPPWGYAIQIVNGKEVIASSYVGAVFLYSNNFHPEINNHHIFLCLEQAEWVLHPFDLQRIKTTICQHLDKWYEVNYAQTLIQSKLMEKIESIQDNGSPLSRRVFHENLTK